MSISTSVHTFMTDMQKRINKILLRIKYIYISIKFNGGNRMEIKAQGEKGAT